MSSNLENDRSVTTGKMYPIDLAPQKITIVKSVSNEVKMAHVIPCQPKTTAAGQIITHAGSVGLMRPAAQIISTNVSSQVNTVLINEARNCYFDKHCFLHHKCFYNHIVVSVLILENNMPIIAYC